MANQYFINRKNAGESAFSEQFAAMYKGIIDYERPTIDLVIYLDHSSIELFADDGQCIMTDIVFPTQPYFKIELFTKKEEAHLNQGKITSFKKHWEKIDFL